MKTRVLCYKKPCECGCGELIDSFGRHPSEKRRFKYGHNLRVKPPISDQTRKKLSEAGKGRIFSDATKQKIRIAISGEKAYNWKGNNVSYRALHSWIRAHKPIPLTCEFCNQEKKLDLANITRIYDRVFSNWKYLCRKCHIKHDDITFFKTVSFEKRSEMAKKAAKTRMLTQSHETRSEAMRRAAVTRTQKKGSKEIS